MADKFQLYEDDFLNIPLEEDKIKVSPTDPLDTIYWLKSDEQKEGRPFVNRLIPYWTTEKPECDGYYWYRQEDGTGDLIHIDMVLSDELGSSETQLPLSSMIEDWKITHWAGPISPPRFIET